MAGGGGGSADAETGLNNAYRTGRLRHRRWTWRQWVLLALVMAPLAAILVGAALV